MNGHLAHGTVLSWDDETGWGVLTSPEVPGEVWAHFSAVDTGPGRFASLKSGEAVLFTWEESEQDGFSYSAVMVRRPGAPEADPVEGEREDDGFVCAICIELDPE